MPSYTLHSTLTKVYDENEDSEWMIDMELLPVSTVLRALFLEWVDDKARNCLSFPPEWTFRLPLGPRRLTSSGEVSSTIGGAVQRLYNRYVCDISLGGEVSVPVSDLAAQKFGFMLDEEDE